MAREDGISMMAMWVNGVHPVSVMGISAAGQKIQLRSERVVRMARQAFVTFLHFLKEHDIGVYRLQGQTNVVNARPTANTRNTFMNIISGDLDFHRPIRVVPTGLPAAARSTNCRLANLCTFIAYLQIVHSSEEASR